MEIVAIPYLKKRKEVEEISCKANLVKKNPAPQNTVARIIKNIDIQKVVKELQLAYK